MAVKCRVLKCGECEVTQSFGTNGHLGTDLVAKGYTLDTILAHSDGVVVITQTGHKNNQGSTGNASYGNLVKIDHGNNNYTLYAHLDSVYVGNGTKVTKGQAIGYMGNSGNSYGGHLHFEVFINNNRVNSYDYFDKDLIEPLVKPTKRDETKEQLKVNVDDLRIRKGAGINQTILGLATLNGIYDYFEVKEQGGYNWYRIADGQWIANSEDWCTIYPKKDDKQTIKGLEQQVEKLIKEKQELIDKNKLLEYENQNLKLSDNKYEVFTATKTAIYYINMVKDETLKYEKS